MDEYYRAQKNMVFAVLCLVGSLALGFAYLAWFQ